MKQTAIKTLVQRWFRYRMEQESRSGALLVVTDPTVRKKVSAALEKQNLRVVAVETASDAIERLETDPQPAPPAYESDIGQRDDSAPPPASDSEDHDGPFDLVVVCAPLFELAALDLIRFIRSRPYDPALFYLSPQPDAGQAAAVLKLGLAGYMTGADLNLDALGERAVTAWRTAVTRRVQEQMIADLRATLQKTVPEGNTVLAHDLERRINESAQKLGPMNRVLLVEADAAVRATLASALQEAELRAEVAMGCESALLLLADDPVDLVVVDPAQAEMAPLEFYTRARQIAPTVEVIVLTERTTVSQAREALEGGVADIIDKPIDNPVSAAQRIRAVLERKRQDKAIEILLTDLYALASQAVSHEAAVSVQSMTDRLFRGIVSPAASPGPLETPLQTGPHPSQDPAKRASTLELASGEYEIIGTAPPQHPSQDPAKRPTTLELSSGEYEVLGDDEAYVAERKNLPDMAVLDYIDKVLRSGTTVGRAVPPQHSTQIFSPGGGRRRMDRAERSFVVTFGPTDSPRTTLGFLKDLSLSGLFVSADPPLPPDTEVHLTIQVPTRQGLQRIGCQGRVVWNTLEDNDKLEVYGPGFGVEFSVIEPKGSEIIRKIVAGYL